LLWACCYRCLCLLSLLGVRAQPASGKPRTDALRNRERILEVAEEAFTHSGANTSLDDIAKHAGVGPGTLYRHFLNRDRLLDAIYRTEVERLAAAERKFAETMPREPLRAWMLLFVDYIATKQIIARYLTPWLEAIRRYSKHRTVGFGCDSCPDIAGRQSGDTRKNLDPIDLLRALIGVANVQPVLTGSKARDDW